MSKRINNKEFIFKCLKALEAHGKVEEIHTLLTNPIVSEKVFGITWSESGGEKCSILKAVLQGMNKDTMRKASNVKDVYYPETINLDGIDYLVYNIQYGEPRDVKNRGFTANLDKRQAAELPQTKETHQWKV